MNPYQANHHLPYFPAQPIQPHHLPATDPTSFILAPSAAHSETISLTPMMIKGGRRASREPGGAGEIFTVVWFHRESHPSRKLLVNRP